MRKQTEQYVGSLFRAHADPVDGLLHLEALEALFKKIGIYTGAATAASTGDDHDDHAHGRRRSVHNVTTTANLTCVTPLALATSFGLVPPLTANEFSLMSVGVLALLDSGACVAASETPSASAIAHNSQQDSWSYTFLATIFVSLASLSGLLVLVFTMRHKARRNSDEDTLSKTPKETFSSMMALPLAVKVTMLCLAIGALVGDTILHLLPIAFGIHAEHTGGEHVHDEEEGDPYLPLWRGCLALLGIYAFIIVEVVLSRFGHSHDHGSEQEHR